MRTSLWLMPLLSVLVSFACGGEGGNGSPGQTAEPPANLLLNGGFERGVDPWFSMTTSAWGAPFRLSEEYAHSGRFSAVLSMDVAPEVSGTRVFGVVQEVAPGELPEVVSGYYRVEDWERGTDRQYLQFVVIVFGAEGLPGDFPNHQIRYPLAGIEQEPFSISNAKFMFIDTAGPAVGEWVSFERNVREDFREAWGSVPEDFSGIRVLFEVRYDGKAAGSGPVRGDVFYDDLYMGPAGVSESRRGEQDSP